MDKAQLIQALMAGGAVDSEDAAEAVLDSLASIVWHALEHGDGVDWPRVGRFTVVPALRHRHAVMFTPASELEVAVNRHHVTA